MDKIIKEFVSIINNEVDIWDDYSEILRKKNNKKLKKIIKKLKKIVKEINKDVW